MSEHSQNVRGDEDEESPGGGAGSQARNVSRETDPLTGALGQPKPGELGSDAAAGIVGRPLAEDDDAELSEQALRVALGSSFDPLARFHDLLGTEGVERGLIGPRETGRLWSRHILNSAAMAGLMTPNSHVIDVGSGAGLPGIVLATLRPDLRLELVEPMERRCRWLQEVSGHLGLANVRITRARAEELHGSRQVDHVVARAVAPLSRLLGWTIPLLHGGGSLVALKGNRAEDEIQAARKVIARLRVREVRILDLPSIAGEASTRVIVAHAELRAGEG